MKKPPTMTRNAVLDRFLDPLSDSFSPAMARRIVNFRADAETQRRVQDLADKCSEGCLRPAERREYTESVRAIHLISILQSKARLALSKSRKAR